MEAALETRPARLACIIAAPEDCTEAKGLRSMVRDVQRSLKLGKLHQIVDLSRVKRMNGRLLATILLLVREVSRAGGTLRLSGPTDEFCKWARTFDMLDPLERRGVLSGH